MKKEEGDFMGHLLGDIQLGITTLLDQKRVCFLVLNSFIFHQSADLAFTVHLGHFSRELSDLLMFKPSLVSHNPELSSLTNKRHLIRIKRFHPMDRRL